ncbi:VOC family protein [Halarcobacter bivalviorum]|uniref:VOC family protein n=1 Tax=Halarcobacter bivalviorum TaxID=663364 RepID=UPI00100C0CB4|nr:VOC family protein [Halarcobacter bivalviorum]RXK08129.1 glyoxalase [Halarcobacter bivalviorum]
MTVGHIGINVNNLEISKKFYIALFDFEVIAESKEAGRKYAFLGNNGELLLTLWEQSDKKFSDSTAGLHHLAFVLKDMEELKSFEEKIEKLNIEKIYENVVAHSKGAESGGLYFLDPDNTRLEVYVKKGLKGYKPAKSNASSCGFF